MNERINNLRLDAGISRLHDEPYLVAVTKSGEIEDPMIRLEKFAESIVEECIQVLKDTGYPNAHGNCVGVEELKQHFGIK